jgi:hypothetical protein
MAVHNTHASLPVGEAAEETDLVEDLDPDAELSDEKKAEIVHSPYLQFSLNRTNVSSFVFIRTESLYANLTCG